MAKVVRLRVIGDQIRLFYDNGTQQPFINTGAYWIPASSAAVAKPPDGGGGTGIDNSGGGGDTPGSVGSPKDDYPWPNAPEDALSPLRYSYRDCTDFVAWRINRDNGCTSSPWAWNWGNLRYQGPGGNGDAIGWKHDWELFNWDVDVPCQAGCIAWFGTSAGAYGHVAYVQSVSGGNMRLEEYNWGGTQAYNTRVVPIPAIDSSHSFLKMPH